jgi:SAM-dependent methyltransferase
MSQTATPVDPARLEQFMHRALGDLGGAISTSLGLIGDRLGLYKAMASAGPLTPVELATRTGTHERYIREWLGNQAAGGYVTYDRASGKYHLTAEQALALADEESPVFLGGAFQVLDAAMRAARRAIENFKTGKGMFWGEHDPWLFEGTERFFRPGYAAHLVSEWIPALEGVQEKLERGATVADVGCGYGASTIIMAKAFPRSRFFGFDYHEASIQAARERAARAQVADRITFQTAGATDFPGKDYDLVAHFDCLHDMGDPVGAARRVRETLAGDGTWMIVEPFAHDDTAENLNPVGRLFFGASTLLCVPNSLAANGPALGAQAGEGRIREVVVEGGGFRHFRRAAETPFNLVFEARP